MVEEESKSKCGEIFRIDNGDYIFICFHCGAEFAAPSDIVDHIDKHFQWTPLPFAAAFSVAVSVKLEDESEAISTTVPPKNVCDVEPKIELNEVERVRQPTESGADKTEDDTEESDHWPGDLFDFVDDNEHKDIASDNMLSGGAEMEPLKTIRHRKKRSKRSKSQTTAAAVLHEPKQSRSKRKSRFVCDSCGKRFVNFSQIREHMNVHANIPPQTYQCDVCSAMFNKKFSLRIHLSRHRSEDFRLTEPLRCKHCGKQFAFFDKFTKHVAAHETVKPYKCTICYNRFVTEKNLERHMSQHEANKFPKSICSQCGKAFPNKSVLTKHFRIHTGERPYACKVCNKTYNTSSYLIIHMRSHTGERPYQCTLCGRTYVAANKLNEHMKTHNNVRPYKCNQCSKTFLLLENLKRHEPKHNQIRPVCKICNKSFSMDRTYRQHMQLHEGIGKYKCRHCDDSFSSSVSRQNHEYNLHRCNDSAVAGTQLVAMQPSTMSVDETGKPPDLQHNL